MYKKKQMVGAKKNMLNKLSCCPKRDTKTYHELMVPLLKLEHYTLAMHSDQLE